MTIQEDGPDPIDVHVGQRMRVRRIQKNMSQSAVAGKMSVSFQQVQKFENAQNRISAARLYKLSRILDVPVEYFFEGLPPHVFVLPGEDFGETGVLREEKQDYGIDLMAHPQAAELLKVFFQIEEGATRRALIDFMKRLGPGEDAMPAVLGPDGALPKRKRGRPRKEG